MCQGGCVCVCVSVFSPKGRGLREWDPTFPRWGQPLLPAPSQVSQLHPSSREVCKIDRDTGLQKDAPDGTLEGEGGDGHPHCCQRKKARMCAGRCRKQGARAASGRGEGCRDPEPQKGRPRKGWAPYFCHPATQGVGGQGEGRGSLPLCFPSREKAPLLFQHDL